MPPIFRPKSSAPQAPAQDWYAANGRIPWSDEPEKHQLNPASMQARQQAMIDANAATGFASDLDPDYWSRKNALAGMKEVFGMFDGGGSGGGGGFLPPGGGGGGSSFGDAPMNYMTAGDAGGDLPRVPTINAPDMTETNAAIFGRAKDQAGQVGRASLQSLRDELGATGMLGSGAEAQGTRDIAARGLGELGEVSRTNAVNESGQKADFAKMKYQGDITQRGQDIAARQAAAQLALQRELARQQMLLAALKQMGGSGGTSAYGPVGGTGGGGGRTFTGPGA